MRGKNLKNTKFKGFTLIELLVVISIIAILAGTIMTVLDPQGKRKKARDSVRRSDVSVVSSAIEQYYADNIAYPDASNPTALYTILNGNNPSNKIYLKTQPNDPSGTGYSYCYNRVNAQTYVLCARLEASTVSELHGAASACSATSPNSTGSGGFFCLTNPF